jgi:hypothetical protein
MPETTEPARPARRRAAACAAVLLVLALAPGVALAAERSPAASPDGPVAPAAAGADTPWSGLWGALTGAWNDLGRLFAADSGEDSPGNDPAGGDGTRKCGTDCGVDIDPNG